MHVQLLTESKVFCACRNSYGDPANENVCPICLGYPGVLPALNREAVTKAYLIASALGSTLSRAVTFERKNYFYPDLPKNYQISQYATPLGKAGQFSFDWHGAEKIIHIREVHLEEDAGKMIHVADLSLLDYNRAGTPLVEVVTHPDLRSGEEAEQFLTAFRSLVRYLGVCDGNLEEGSLRCDANVSISRSEAELGEKVEIKNLNSFKFVRSAINFETERQAHQLAAGEPVISETRLWNENRDVTESMRVKETDSDYRYFPEPDLPPYQLDDPFFAALAARAVELPLPRRRRFESAYGLGAAQAAFITAEPDTARFFEACVKLGAAPGATARWLTEEVQRLLHQRHESLGASALTPERLAELLQLIAAGSINGKIAKQVLKASLESDRDPQRIVDQEGLRPVTDPSTLEALLVEVIATHPRVEAQLAAGDPKPIGFLVGQLMQRTNGQADPAAINALINARLAAATSR
jgi:aspartyl-tRNA(Asn)/glutamyl-tRNA(Gln) amidotransferase subunit B